MSRARFVVTLVAVVAVLTGALSGCGRRTGVTELPVEEVAPPEGGPVQAGAGAPTTEPSEDEPTTGRGAETGEPSKPTFAVDMSGLWHWEVRWIEPSEGKWLSLAASAETGGARMELFPYSEQVSKGLTYERGTYLVSACVAVAGEDDSTTDLRPLSAEELAAICEVKAVAGPGIQGP